jgi:O-antigen ligase
MMIVILVYGGFFLSKKGSFQSRLETHDYLLKLFNEKPLLGVGAGNFEFYAEKEGLEYINAHDMWGEVLVNFGVIGFIFYTAFYLGLLIKLNDVIKRAKDRFFEYLSWSLFSALLAFIPSSFSPSSVFIGFDIMWIYFGLSLAIIFYMGGRLKNESAHSKSILLS